VSGSRQPRALITGITGQDGSFLAEELLARGYAVTGVTRRAAGAGVGRVEPHCASISWLHGDLTDPAVLAAIVGSAPDELYHLAAPTFVPDSWERPAATLAAIYGSTAALLSAITASASACRVFVAGSGEMFGDAAISPQDEDTACRPRNPYATAKLAAHQLVGQWRSRSDCFAVSGILFNHESERRPPQFVSRKITLAVAEIALGRRERLELGDLSAVRDWSYAPDIMHGAWLSLQHERPDDYVFASGVGHSVAELVTAAFAHAGLDPERYVSVDPGLVRAAETVPPVGDPGRARAQLGWEPTLGYATMIGRMVDADIAALRGDPTHT
jgi:GDPmannose 4,6-dehydratase